MRVFGGADTSMIPSKGVCVSMCRLLRRGRAVNAALCVLAAGVLAGCSSSDGVGSLMVDPAPLFRLPLRWSRDAIEGPARAGAGFVQPHGQGERRRRRRCDRKLILSSRLREYVGRGEALAAHGGREKVRPAAAGGGSFADAGSIFGTAGSNPGTGISKRSDHPLSFWSRRRVKPPSRSDQRLIKPPITAAMAQPATASSTRTAALMAVARPPAKNAA